MKWTRLRKRREHYDDLNERRDEELDKFWFSLPARERWKIYSGLAKFFVKHGGAKGMHIRRHMHLGLYDYFDYKFIVRKGRYSMKKGE